MAKQSQSDHVVTLEETMNLHTFIMELCKGLAFFCKDLFSLCPLW
jgi:hypothetical protein